MDLSVLTSSLPAVASMPFCPATAKLERVLSYFDLSRGESKEIPVKLTATYKGRYYLPSVYCEAMYDNAVRALKKGQWVEVVD